MTERHWGKRSKEVYATLDPVLQDIVDYVLHEVADISLIKGHRNQREQDEAFRKGTSQLKWPHGKHNSLPSTAVDLQPYPPPEDDKRLWAALGYIAGAAIEYAKSVNVELRWGFDWDRDGDLTDNEFMDGFHLELV